MSDELDTALHQFHRRFDRDYIPQKRRLLTALTREFRSKGAPGSGLNRRHWLWSWNTRAAVAAIALLVVGYGVYTLTVRPAMAWAEVRSQIRRAGTVVFLQGQHVSTSGYWTGLDASSMPVEREVKCLVKTPGLFRMESWRRPNTSQPADWKSVPESVQISKQITDEYVQIQLQPFEKRGMRMVTRYEGATRVPDHSDDPERFLTRLQQLREEDLRTLGWAVIDGAEATGFEAPARLLFPHSIPDPESKVRVWANRETALPVRLELRFRQQGSYVTMVVSQIEWGVALPDDLFDVPDEPGWTIEDHTIVSVAFSKTKLKQGIALRVGPLDGEPVVTEKDIADVASGWERNEGMYRSVTVELTPAGRDRLQTYTGAHVGEVLTIVFNREILGEVLIGGPMQNLQLDITSSGMTFEEWGQNYLTSQRE